MTDRELLELAARAAGEWPSPEPFEHVLGRRNPLTDDGDALRLASAIGLTVNFHTGNVYGPLDVVGRRAHAIDRDNIRRAIVRAAAEIGRAM